MKINTNDYAEVTEVLKEISSLASKKINEIYSDDIKEFRKEDNSPVTVADIESNRIIIDKLSKNFRNIKLISEESSERSLQGEEEFFIIDPLDGTKEFIKKNGEFTVNIALIQKTRPVLGIVELPVSFTQYYSDGYKSYKKVKNLEKIITSEKLKDYVITISRSHQDDKTNEFIKNLKKNTDKSVNTTEAGSSLKFCLIAEGLANIYIRTGNTMEWDIAAGNAVLNTANANLCDTSLNKLRYGKEHFKNQAFIAFSKDLDTNIIRKCLSDINII
mgnify:FL=1